MKRPLIYLADLTHRGLILSSNVFPLSIGLVGAYLLKTRRDVEVELFKYPEDLSRALERRQPDIAGFANYSWNLNLGYGYATAIKSLYPETAVVFGGPNYGLSEEEVRSFWNRYPLLDFYIVREGERAFAELVEALLGAGLHAASLRASGRPLANCHYVSGDDIVQGPTLPRLPLSDLPSPYLMGLMDKFFDDELCPMIHTTRGCPFKCTFCTEGSSYYDTIGQREDLRDELHYISERVRGPRELFISDANFGMYRQDIEKARLIAECQRRYGYPKHIHASTGKNQKERVIEIAQMLGGALNMAASLQSTDPTVLNNVARSNISRDKLSEIGLRANRSETGTFSELILGLPGDSLRSHRQSLRDTVQANFDNIRMYQLILLPQTQLNTPENRLAYGMRSKFRIMPRSFGRYRLLDREFVCVESEEILTENATLPFEDYITCREMDLTVEILHNGRVYAELQGFCQSAGLSWFDFMMRFFEKRRTYSDELRRLYDDFRESHTKRLWEKREELEEAVAGSIDAALRDDRGTNEMSTGKATAFFQLFDQINDILFDELRSSLDEQGRLDELTADYLEAGRTFSRVRKANLIDYEAEFVERFAFDIRGFERGEFGVPLRLSRPSDFVVTHTAAQRAQLAGYIKEFGTTPDGLGKMLMRFPHVHRVFRRVQAAQ